MNYEKMEKHVVDNEDSIIEYVEHNAKKIALQINEDFERQKDKIREELMTIIENWLSPIPIHYEWEDDGCPYDSSGIIVVDGLITLDQTISEFLANEYTGYCEATYMSGQGFNYETFGEKLSYETLRIGFDIMICTIKRCLETHFKIKLTEEDLREIQSSCNEFDDIYDECFTSYFFWYETAIEFAGIGNIKLNEIDRYHTTDRKIREE